MSLDEQQRVIEAMRADLHPPRGVSVPRLSGCRCWRRSPGAAGRLAVAAHVDAAGRAGGGGARAARRLPLGPPAGAGAAAAGRPGHRLVGADRVRDPGAAEPDVGDTRRARDRDLDRVQRAAGRAPPRGADRRPSGAPRRCAAPTARTGAAVAASGVTAIMGFGVLVLSDISMLRDFGLVTLVDLSVSLVGRAGRRCPRSCCWPSPIGLPPETRAPRSLPPGGSSSGSSGLGARGGGARAGRHAPASSSPASATVAGRRCWRS